MPVGGVTGLDVQVVFEASVLKEFLESNQGIEFFGLVKIDFVLILVGDEDGLILLKSELIEFGLKRASVLDRILQANS